MGGKGVMGGPRQQDMAVLDHTRPASKPQGLEMAEDGRNTMITRTTNASALPEQLAHLVPIPFFIPTDGHILRQRRRHRGSRSNFTRRHLGFRLTKFERRRCV